MFFFLIVLNISFATSLVFYTCPINSTTNEKLSQIKQTLLCNAKLNCDYFETIFTSSYTRNVIVIHFDLKQLISYVDSFNKWSYCGIRTVIVDGRNNNNNNTITNFSQICSRNKNTVVLTLTNSSVDFFQPDTIRACILKDIGYIGPYHIADRIISSCFNTVWIDGKSDCSLNSSQRNIQVHYIIGNGERSTVNLSDSSGVMTLKIGTLDYPSFAYPTSVNGKIKYTGPVFQLVDRLADKLNFKYEVYPVIDGKYGNLVNGSWNGLVGMLLRKDIDLIAAALTISKARNDVLDYTSSFHYEPYGILLHKSKASNQLWNALSVFSGTVWLFVIVTMILATIYCFIIHKFNPRMVVTGFDNIGACVWYFIASLLNQDSDVESNSWSARNFLAFWWLYVVAIIAVYSGLLVAMLSTGKSTLPFNDFGELAKVASTGAYKLCLVDGTATIEAINTGSSETYRLYKSIIRTHPEYVKGSNDECLKYLLKNKDVAYLAQRSTLEFYQMQNCETTQLLVISMYEQGGYLALALQKDSSLTGIFSLEIQQVVDEGLLEDWKTKTAKLLNNHSNCVIEAPDEYLKSVTEPLKLEALGGSFLMLLIGISIGLLAFITETYFNYKTKNRKTV